jgi:retinol dehydrogenase-12
MDKKIALVTGGTSGVGLSILRELVERDVHVHFIGTSSNKGKAIELELNGPNGRRCDFIQLDLSDLGAVRAFAKRFRTEVPVLDLLLNVAGLMLPRRQVTSEGFEKTFAIGYLSAVLLSTELAPALEQASQARILNVGGLPRFVLKPGRLDLDDLGFEKDYSGMRVAIDTVHAKTVVTEILAERLRGRGIDVNSFHPGAVKGQVARNMPLLKRSIFSVLNLFMSSTSKSGVYVSTSEEIRGMTGQFFVGNKPRPLRFDSEYKGELWERTEQMLAQVS